MAAAGAGLVVVVAVAVAIGLKGGGPSTSAASSGRAPTSGFALLDGRRSSFAAFQGKPLVVNFMASWCTACQRELPAFQGVSDQLAGKVAFLGVDLQDAISDGQALVSRTGVRYPVASDPDGSLFTAFRSTSMPTTVLIDAQGNVLWRHSGEITGDELRASLQKVL